MAKPRNQTSGLRFLLNYLLPHAWAMILGLVMLSLGCAASLVFPSLCGLLIDKATLSGDQTFGFISPFETLNINQLAIVLFFTAFLQGCVVLIAMIMLGHAAQHAIRKLRIELYQHILGLPMSFFERKEAGQITSKISNDIDLVEGVFIHVIPKAIQTLFALIGGVAVIIITSTKLTLLMAALVPILFTAASVIGRRIKNASTQTQESIGVWVSAINQVVQSIISVKIFSNEQHEASRFVRLYSKTFSGRKSQIWWSTFFSSFSTIAILCCVISVLWFGCFLLVNKEITTGELTRFFIYSIFISSALGQGAGLLSDAQRSLGALQNVQELFAENIDNFNTSAESLDCPISNRIDTVELKNLSFSYPTRPSVLALSNVSLSIHCGQTVALIGKSGSGKSTVAALLLRLYTPNDGSIMLDGRNISDHPLSYVRNRISLVPQDVILFEGTIRDNIAYGRLAATDNEILHAARAANALEFIDRLPSGIHTMVGERGAKLSGGQRQRIAIARVFLKDPALLILDEATSSLDRENAGLVEEALQLLMKNRSTLIITHRLSSIKMCDRIVVLDSGKVVASGTQEELQRFDEYKSLFVQSSGAATTD